MSSSFAASASNTSINVLPIIFLFCSGSSTPFKCLKNIFCASTFIRFKSISFLNVCITSSASFFLSSPLSTNTHIRLSPIALDNSAAVTDESTPPERPKRTFSPFVTLFISSTRLVIKSSSFHSGLHEQISKIKLSKINLPPSV